MSSFSSQIVISVCFFFNVIFRLGIFKSIYWVYWFFKQTLLSLIAFPQPNVTKFGKFYVVSFTIKNTRCKLICREGPYIIDIMEDADHSVRDELQPFFQVIPVNPYQIAEGKELMVTLLGEPEAQIAHIPYSILGPNEHKQPHLCAKTIPHHVR